MTDSNVINGQMSASNNNSNSNSNNNYNNKQNHNTTLRLKLPNENAWGEHGTDQKHQQSENGEKRLQKKRRDKSDLGDDFVPPDGGWGWVVAMASGVNILVTFALAQQFGIIFHGRMQALGISSAELTTIINIQIAVSAFTGLLNGPLFRRYTYRQVAVVGSVLTFLGLFLIVFADTFEVYVLGFSIIYGFGRGLTVSASSLAVNTYFKQKRRTATAYQFGVAGLGPIVCPYFATYLLNSLGVQGTVAIFAAISLHTIACSLVYQPVRWHVVKREKDAEALKRTGNVDGDNNDDHDDDTDSDSDIIKQIVEPETPVLPRANDGWFGSRASLNSGGARNRLNSGDRQQQQHQQQADNGHVELKRLNSKDSANYSNKTRSFSVSHSIREEDDDDEHHDNHRHSTALVIADNKAIPILQQQQQQQKMPINSKHEAIAENNELTEEERRKKLPFYQKIIIFFDLDLLRDITYVNLAVGITLINFVEINFAILTPFILYDFGFEQSQVALAMSSLGFCDLVIRFLIPAITARMNFSNKTFFIIGIGGMCVGRVFLSFTRDFYAMVGIFIWLGLNKAFRTVFWSLIIPGYVPLKRLPAAAGLQLLMSGTFSMVFGPLIGLIRERTDYAFTLNFLNALCLLAIALWLIEDFVRQRQRKSKPVTDDLK